jgi:hypothetical protein
MATMSYWKTLKTVQNLAEKTSLRNPWKTKLSKYGKLFSELLLKKKQNVTQSFLRICKRISFFC